MALLEGVVVGARDKRGSRSVAFQPPQKAIKAFFVEDQEFAALHPVLEALRTAGVNVSIGSESSPE